jgi:hypothetical protein
MNMGCKQVRTAESIVAYLVKVLPQDAYGNTEENHGKSQSGLKVTQPRFKQCISRTDPTRFYSFL